jgi:hypothetical protein
MMPIRELCSTALVALFLVASATALAVPGGSLIETQEDPALLKCGNFTPTFCGMVNWNVAKARLVGTDSQEMLIQMSYFNQPGTWNCKKEYKEFQCRISFPMCSTKQPVMPPCRSSCEEFAQRCPGSDVSCEDLVAGDKGCYEFNYADYIAKKEAQVSGGGKLSGVAIIILTFVVLFIFSGAAFMSQKMQTQFEKAQ